MQENRIFRCPGSAHLAPVMKQRYWHIEGHDSFEKIYDKKVKLGCFSENQIKDLLKALTAKAAFSFNEIAGAYAKKNTRIIK